MKLPELIRLVDHGNDWDVYLEAVYELFQADFVHKRPVFRGTRLGLKKHPQVEGKEATFWHLISEGKIEVERVKDESRCERIKWPKPIIDDCDSYPEYVKVWENTRVNKDGVTEGRICICFGDWEYLVVLAKRKEYLIPWTAYPVTYSHTKRKLEKEYKSFHGI
ncbi:MAG TPA: hypothetical protein PK609_00315 [Candidatus Paceibacterota bacterium]|nr:hypothetical protein [Candidatus Paceibacterota bacterium]